MSNIDKNRLFGQIAVKSGLITEAERDETLALQAADIEKGVNKHIGIYFFENNLLTKEQIQKILEYQNKLIKSQTQSQNNVPPNTVQAPSKQEDINAPLSTDVSNKPPDVNNDLSIETIKIIEEELRYEKIKNFFRAAEKNDINAILEYLKSGNDVNAKNKMGFTAIMIATRAGQTAALKTLLDRGASVHEKSEAGFNAMNFTGINQDCAKLLNEFSLNTPVEKKTEDENKTAPLLDNAQTVRTIPNDTNNASPQNIHKNPRFSSLFLLIILIAAVLLSSATYYARPYYLQYRENQMIEKMVSEKNEEEIIKYISQNLKSNLKIEKIENLISRTVDIKNEKCMDYYEKLALSTQNKSKQFSLLILSQFNSCEITFKDTDSVLDLFLLSDDNTDEVKTELGKMVSKLNKKHINDYLKRKLIETHSLRKIEVTKNLLDYYIKYNTISLSTLENSLLTEIKAYKEMEKFKKINIDLNAEIEKFDNTNSNFTVKSRTDDGYYICEKISGPLPDDEFLINNNEYLSIGYSYNHILVYQKRLSIEWSYGRGYSKQYSHTSTYSMYNIDSRYNYSNIVEKSNESRETSTKAYEIFIRLEKEFKFYHEVNINLLNDHFKITTDKKITN